MIPSLPTITSPQPFPKLYLLGPYHPRSLQPSQHLSLQLCHHLWVLCYTPKYPWALSQPQFTPHAPAPTLPPPSYNHSLLKTINYPSTTPHHLAPSASSLLSQPSNTADHNIESPCSSYSFSTAYPMCSQPNTPDALPINTDLKSGL